MTDGMNEKEVIRELIDEFPEKEVEYQLKVVKAKLESCGIITSELEIRK